MDITDLFIKLRFLNVEKLHFPPIEKYSGKFLPDISLTILATYVIIVTFIHNNLNALLLVRRKISKVESNHMGELCFERAFTW